MTPIFFDTFFNLEKYLDHEQKDPFASQRDVDEDGNEVNISYTLFKDIFSSKLEFNFRCRIGIALPPKNTNF